MAGAQPLDSPIVNPLWHVDLPPAASVPDLPCLPTSPLWASSPHAWHPWAGPRCHYPGARHPFHPSASRLGLVSGISDHTTASGFFSVTVPSNGVAMGPM